MIKTQVWNLTVLTCLHPNKKISAACRCVAQLKQLLQNNWEECLVVDFHVSRILCIRMLSVKLRTSAGSNFESIWTVQDGRVLACFECLTMTQSFCLSLLDIYGSSANTVHMTWKDLTKPLYQPSISSSRDRGEKSGDFETIVPAVLLPCSIKAEIGWHCCFVPGLSHIIH